MKFYYTLLLLLILHVPAIADHVVGGELLYSHVSGHTYKITLIVYGECSGGSFSHLKNAEPRINILNEKSAFLTLILSEETNLRTEVTNVCPADAHKTTCKSPQGTIPGITKFVYSGTANLIPSAKWRMLFAGQMDNTGKSQSGYSSLISNMKTNSGYGFYLYLEAELNNLHSNNNSPEYTTTPTPLYCVNIPQQYNPGAIDKDKDELRYSLTAPLDINGIVSEYIPPYTATEPIATVPGSFSHNAATGQLAFTPAKTEIALVVQKTDEYRNGAWIGSCSRAMTFFISSQCSNQSPSGDIDPNSVSGGMLHNNIINQCKGSHTVKFAIPVADKNNDNIQVVLSNLPAGATANVQNNNTKNPLIDFEWNINTIQPGSYTFYANYNDGACPNPGNQVMSYTVNIVYPISIFHEVQEPTNCKHKQIMQFHLDGGVLPRKIIITNDANIVVSTRTEETATFTDSFETGAYKVLVYADYLPCSTTYNFEVSDYGTYPEPPLFEDINHCLGDPVRELNPIAARNGVVKWYSAQGELLANKPTYTTDSVGQYQWIINQKVKVCESVSDTVNVWVHPYPKVFAKNEDGHACVGDGIYLEAVGAVSYEWEPAEKIVFYDERPFAYIYQPETFVVTGYSKYGCAATDTLIFDDIEACCLFSYPNAFTPNADGINDGWHPITYGNVDFYLLCVYNRWGQRLFTTSNPKEKWDGTSGGKKCDLGTYYYKLKATCITGQQEEAGGSFVLIH